jgi:glyoxylase-like metal-dependent hydrolase (beta-lactamase superfamily II)
LIFKQIKGNGDNFSYVIGDDRTREAAIVDPSFNGDRIIEYSRQNNLKIKYIILTHHHPDHVGESGKLKDVLGAKLVAHRLSSVKKDLEVDDGDFLMLGGLEVKVIHTPGHTRDGICLLADGIVLTGDTLFVGECGRTDLPDGSSEEMFDSLFNKLMALDDDIQVYPGHDYGGTPHSSIGEERKSNYTLRRRSLAEFVNFMKEP